MRKLFVLTIIVVSTVYGCTYGTERKTRKIVSAVYDENHSQVVFAVHTHWDRPATGLAAFPDGGIAQVTLNRNTLGVYRMADEKFQKLEQTEDRSTGGTYQVDLFNVRYFLITKNVGRADQMKVLLDLASYSQVPFPELQRELTARNSKLGSCEIGGFRAIDETLRMLVCERRDDQEWLLERDASGKYSEIGAVKHFYGQEGSTIFYFSADLKTVLLNLDTGERKIISEYQGNLNKILITHDPVVDRIQGKSHRPRGPEVRIDEENLVVIENSEERSLSHLPSDF